MARNGDELDPTWVTNQPALTTSGGRIWLIVGGLFAAISLITLAFVTGLGSPGVAIFGIVTVAGLYVAMIIVRFVVPAGRLRLGLLASLMIAMALCALTCVAVVMISEWAAV